MSQASRPPASCQGTLKLCLLQKNKIPFHELACLGKQTGEGCQRQPDDSSGRCLCVDRGDLMETGGPSKSFHWESLEGLHSRDPVCTESVGSRCPCVISLTLP